MPLKRHQKYAFAFFIASGLYAALLASLNIPEYRSMILSFAQLSDIEANVEKIRFVIHALPWFALICLGCYCLYRLGMDLLSYRERPDEIPKLAEDVKKAREDLQRRGFKFQ